MTSIGARTRQVNSDTGYYIPLVGLDDRTPANGGLITAPATTGGALGGAPTWALTTTSPIDFTALALISSAGAGLLKDMGKTIVSSTRVFRKVQLVVPARVGTRDIGSTFGVGGPSGTTLPATDFYTAYIELGSEGGGSPTRVALFGR